jgi:hypothetical protein
MKGNFAEAFYFVQNKGAGVALNKCNTVTFGKTGVEDYFLP